MIDPAHRDAEIAELLRRARTTGLDLDARANLAVLLLDRFEELGHDADLNQALLLLREALAECDHQTGAPIRFWLAMALSMGPPEGRAEAIVLLDQLAAELPDRAPAYGEVVFRRAMLCVFGRDGRETGELRIAVDQIERLLAAGPEIFPDQARLSDTLAFAHWALGERVMDEQLPGIGLDFVQAMALPEPVDLGEAVLNFRRGLDLCPGDVDLALSLGVACLAQRDESSLLIAITAVGRQSPADADESDLLTELSALLRAELDVPPGPHAVRHPKVLREALAGLPVEHPARSALLLELGEVCCSATAEGPACGDFGVALTCLTEVVERSDLEEWQLDRAVALLLYAMTAGALFDHLDFDFGRIVAAVVVRSSDVGAAAGVRRACVLAARSWAEADRSRLTAAASHLAAALDAAGPGEGMPWDVLAITGAIFFYERVLATGRLEFLSHAERCRDALETMPGPAEEVRRLRGRFRLDLAMLRSHDTTLDGEGEEEFTRLARIFAALLSGRIAGTTHYGAPAEVTQHGERGEYRLDLERRAAILIERGHLGDQVALDKGIDLLQRAITRPPIHLGAFVPTEGVLGSALVRRAKETGRADLEAGIGHLERAADVARRDIGAPWADRILSGLAEAYRTRARAGDLARAVDVGLESLRVRLGNLITQNRVERELPSDATDPATQVAQWAFADGRMEDGLRALEYGRALAQHATTLLTDVPGLLRAEEEHALAGEWDAELAGAGPYAAAFGADVPGGLRARVIDTLLGVPGRSGVFTPPGAREIAAGLRDGGWDALVHLLPGTRHGEGMAVIVRPDETMATVGLPELHLGRRSVPTAHLITQRTVQATVRRVGQLDSVTRRRWQENLDQVCEWAGALLAPVLEQIPGRTALARVVLVPWGTLAAVPWHAARVDGDHLLRRALFSYAASGDQMIATSRLAGPRSGVPVLVADPAGPPLTWAKWECEEIRRSCHPTAARLGRWLNSGAARTGEASADVLLTALATASTVHFAGHGAAGRSPAASRLLLQDGLSESPLTLRQIMHEVRLPESLIVLSAAESDLSTGECDESATLAACFLAAGASSVVGSRWMLGDDIRTAAMMIVFHQALRSSGLGPADALRQAQMWMLSGDRDLLRRISPALYQMSDGHDFADPTIWAAFTHHGHA
ncbi:CHAT domain-containing protein [Streptosporangiaceae bacterium NEAU-GS5]|nr:CHAT domain-containing protein [Streptosporangiaceae bacterium NEAU-GS5]